MIRHAEPEVAPLYRLRLAVVYRLRTLRRKLWQHGVKGRMGINHVRNYVTDLQWGGFAGGAKASGRNGALGFSSVDYEQLRKIFNRANGLAIGPDDVLVDVGCGKGRVINWWLGLGLGNRIYGLELDEELAEHARRRLAHQPNVSILTGDALDHLPPEATILFLFNPFLGEVIERFKERVLEVYGPGSPVRIVYFMPMFEDRFASDPRFSVRPGRTKTIYRTVVITLAGEAES